MSTRKGFNKPMPRPISMLPLPVSSKNVPRPPKLQQQNAVITDFFKTSKYSSRFLGTAPLPISRHHIAVPHGQSTTNSQELDAELSRYPTFLCLTETKTLLAIKHSLVNFTSTRTHNNISYNLDGSANFGDTISSITCLVVKSAP